MNIIVFYFLIASDGLDNTAVKQFYIYLDCQKQILEFYTLN